MVGETRETLDAACGRHDARALARKCNYRLAPPSAVPPLIQTAAPPVPIHPESSSHLLRVGPRHPRGIVGVRLCGARFDTERLEPQRMTVEAKINGKAARTCQLM